MIANGSESTVVVGVASVRILQANTLRYGVVFSTPKTARVSVSKNNPATVGAGVTLQPGQAPVTLTCDDVGNWLSGDLFAIADAGSEPIGIVELLCLPDKYNSNQ